MADMENNATQNGETNTTEPTGINGKGPKSFTQEEVDRIVQDRLAREKKKYQQQEPDPFQEREQALVKREAALGVKELLTEEGYPMELSEIIEYKDLDDFKRKYEALKEFLPDPNAPRIVISKSTNGGAYNEDGTEDKELRKAMGLR